MKHSEETKRKMSMSQKGRRHSEERRGENNSFFGKHHSKETRLKMSKILKGKPTWNKGLTKETDERVRRMSELNTGKKHSEETKQKMSKVRRGRKLSEEHIRNLMAACQVKPNRTESCLAELLSKCFPNEFKFVGDGQLIVGGRVPDFVNCNGKKQLIELYGTYWHSEKITGRCREAEEAYSIDHYAKLGFKTLIIWENELKHPKKVVERVRQAFY